MRHSDPKLTMKHYARIRLANQAKAVEALERPGARGVHFVGNKAHSMPQNETKEEAG